jgi:MarR family transcriptional regulator, lower aerobic nicotinate degradation pathway regulator
MKTDAVPKAEAVETVDRLYRRLGFLLRRAHQIADAVFEAECGKFGLTASQCGTLVVANSGARLDQTSIGLALGFDRATTGEILKGLQGRGLISRKPSVEDARKRVIALTPRGRKTLEQLGAGLERAQERLLVPFTPQDSATLRALLERFCHAHNNAARALLVRPEPPAEPRTPG